MQSFKKVPEFLSIADIFAIPQDNSLSSVGQIPAKVFDAMAMAKPIITTNVSDLPFILNGCGWIVKSGNPLQLAEKIEYVLNNPKEAQDIGLKARKRCIELYSLNVMKESVLGILSNL